VARRSLEKAAEEVSVLGGLAFSFEMKDGADRLDPRVWKAVLGAVLARTGDGLVVCDADLGVLYATGRAQHLLGRLGMGPDRVLPEVVAKVVTDKLADDGAARPEAIVAVRGGSTLHVEVDLLRGVAPARAAVWIREASLRDDELFAALRERFAISARGFQLAQLVRRGLSNRRIAEELRLTESTVKVYLHRLYRDCGVTSRTGLIALLERVVR